MRKSLIIALTALTLSATTAGIAMAHEKGDGPGRHNPQERMERMAERLGLTDEQRSEMQALMEKERDQRPQRGEGREVYGKLRDLDPNAADYQQQLDSLVKQAQDQVGERIRARAAHRAAVAEILTDEQEQKLADWKKERMEHRQEHQGDKRHHGRRGDCEPGME